MKDDRFDRYREEVPGRTSMKDTPELVAYYREIEGMQAGALWTVANKIEPWEPIFASVPVGFGVIANCAKTWFARFPWSRPRRRPTHYQSEQPGAPRRSAAVGWLYSGLQVMHPGEGASTHRHSASALRFIMGDRGAYTIVAGRV